MGLRGTVENIRKSKTLYKKSLTDTNKYKNYNYTLQKVKRQATKQYYIDQYTKFRNNTENIWKMINKISSK